MPRLAPLARALALAAPIAIACGDAAPNPQPVASDAGVRDAAPAGPSCSDGVTNGAETDRDCGGATACARCAIGLRCAAPADCASGACRDGLCAAAPTIARVTPPRAGTAGGDPVEITGAGFTAGPSVALGPAPALAVVTRDPGRLTATTGPNPGKSGLVDVAVANADGGRATLAKAFRYYLSDVRTAAPTSQVASLPTNPFPKDVDGDGKLDLVAGSQGPAALVARGVGDGTIGAPEAIPLGISSAYAVVVADMNGDGKLDLVAGDAAGASVGVVLAGGAGWSAPVVAAAGGAAYFVAVADFDADGKLDVVAPALGGATAPVLLRGKGDGTFAAGEPLAAGANTVAALAADLDGDGKVDLVLSRFDAAGTLDVLKGKGDGTFEPAVTYAVGAQPWLPSVGDVDGDGRLDLVVGNLGSGDVSFLRGKGGGVFAVAITLPGDGRNHTTALVDLDDDGDLDLVTIAFDDGAVRYRRGRRDGTFEPSIVIARAAPSSVGFALGDLNGDGRPDVCVGQSAAGLLSVFPDASR